MGIYVWIYWIINGAQFLIFLLF